MGEQTCNIVLFEKEKAWHGRQTGQGVGAGEEEVEAVEGRKERKEKGAVRHVSWW